MDSKYLNQVIQCEIYPIPTVEEITTKFSGAQVFTVVDVKSGFWHIPLHEELTYLTCFNTPFGSYRCLRMPFGILSAPEVFQRWMHQLKEGLSRVEVIHDNFIVVGCGKTYEGLKKHEKNLRGLLLR